MQLRISQGPESALGLGDAFSAEDVRARFLSLTKQFHPARFGRMSTELQRLSNEVFLGIKAAHEAMLKLLGAPSRATGPARASGGIPPIAAEGATRTPSSRPTGAMPRLSSAGTTPPTTQLARGTDRAATSSRTATPPSGVRVTTANQSGSIPRVAESGALPRQPALTPSGSVPLARQGTPAPGTTSPIARPGTLPPGQTSPLPRQAMPTPAQASPAVRQATPPPGQTSPIARPGTPAADQTRPPTLPPGQTSPIARQGTPAPGQTVPIARQGTPVPGQTSPLARHGTPAPGQTSPIPRPNTPSPQNFNPATQRGFQGGATSRPDQPTKPPAPSSTNFNVATQRGVASAQPPPTQQIQRVANEFDETAALNEALMLMEQRDWTAARQCLHALAAKIPQSKPYRALLCYTRGREAHAAGRAEDALLEYQRALQLDPDLAQVKQAVAELQRRR